MQVKKLPLKLSKNTTLVKRNMSKAVLEIKGKCVAIHETEDKYLVVIKLSTLDALLKALKET